MKTGSYIFAKHPNGSKFYPAKADRVTPKFVFFTDDDGKRIKVAKSACRLQEEWANENVN